jgi:hypothetical protein
MPKFTAASSQHDALTRRDARLGSVLARRRLGESIARSPSRSRWQLAPTQRGSPLLSRRRPARGGTAPLPLGVGSVRRTEPRSWYLVSDEPTDRQTFEEYGLRFDLEENFLDDKSNGFRVESSRLETAEALERLFLVLAVATLHFTSGGVGVVRRIARTPRL